MFERGLLFDSCTVSPLRALLGPQGVKFLMRRSFQILTISSMLCLIESAAAQVALEASPETGSKPAMDVLREMEPEQTARTQTEYWTRSLGLTEAQAQQLSALNLTFATEAQAIARGQSNDAEKIGAIETVDNDREEDVLAILTEKQRALYIEFIQKRDLWVQQHIEQIK